MSKRINIKSADFVQGNLYAIHTEDSVAHVADTFILAHAVNGKTYICTSMKVPGYVTDPEHGQNHPNRNYKTEAGLLCEQVEQVGSINPAKWSEYKLPTLEEREEYNLRCEADEKAWGL